MKTKSKLLVAVSIIAALCIGFFIGLSVNGTKVNKSNVSGTIANGKHKTCTSPKAMSNACVDCHL